MRCVWFGQAKLSASMYSRRVACFGHVDEASQNIVYQDLRCGFLHLLELHKKEKYVLCH